MYARIVVWTIRREHHESSDAKRLIDALDRELTETYPEEGATFFDLLAVDVAEGHGAFLVAREGTTPVGCGAVRLLGERRAELKRMYVVPEARGRGVASALLTELERTAVALGVRELVLETGARQVDALRLYERAGFVPVPAFGPYANSPLSTCLGKRLPRENAPGE